MNSLTVSAIPNYKFRDRSMAQKAASAVERLHAMARKHVKFADLGGDQESSFEQAFAQLAYSMLQDKAPRLLDYLVGFQLVDRNDDSTKAIGIFGFKAGSQWLYAPVFFINGELKGHELLYIKNSDIFVPLTESWLSYVLAKKPYILGEGTDRHIGQLGVRAPDLRRLAVPPGHSKTGSADVILPSDWPDWMCQFAPRLASLLTDSPMTMAKYAGLDARLSLDNVFAQDLALCKVAYEVSRKYPSLGEYFEKFYGPGLFKQALLKLRKTASASDPSPVFVAPRMEWGPPSKGILGNRESKTAASEKVKIKLDTDKVTTDNLGEMTDEKREKLLRDGYLVEDSRTGDEVSIAYNTQVELALTNPDMTGLYDVLVKPGKFERCLVVVSPHSNYGRKGFCTVVRLDGEKNWKNAHKQEVFVKPNTSNYEEFGKWLADQKSPESFKTSTTYIAISRDGTGSVPFRIRDRVDEGLYNVRFEDYGPTRGPWDSTSVPDYEYGYSGGPCCCNGNSDPDRVQLNQREGTRLKSIRGVLYIPQEAKIITIKVSDSDWDQPEPVGNEDASKNPPIRIGNMADLQAELIQKSAKFDPDETLGEEDYVKAQVTKHPRYYNGKSRPKPKKNVVLNDPGLAPKMAFELGTIKDLQDIVENETEILKLAHFGTEVVINGRKPMPTKQAMFSLIRQYGLREATAKELLKEAEAHNVVRFRVKYAADYPMLGPGPDAPPMNLPTVTNEYTQPSAPTQLPQEEEQIVPGLAPGNFDPSVYRWQPEYMQQPYQWSDVDPSAVQSAQQAGQQGFKDIFDTSMLSGLLKSLNKSTEISRYGADLLKAVDRLGRLLFLMCWRSDQFEDMFGKAKLPALEDAIRNAFEQVGEVALEIRAGHNTPWAEDSGPGTNVDDTSEV